MTSRCFVSQDIEYVLICGISDHSEAEGETWVATVDRTSSTLNQKGKHMQKQKLWLKRSKNHKMLWRLAALFVEKPMMMSGFSVRGAEIGHMKTNTCDMCAYV